MQTRVKWGVVGAGGIARRRTIPGMLESETAELYAVMEPEMTLAEEIRLEFQAAKAFDTIDALLSETAIEAVYIASPVVFHKKQAMQAADSGKHILLEKPLALTSAEARDVAEHCRQKGVLLATGFMMRFHAHHRRMRRYAAENRIGDIVSARAQLTCWYPDMPNAWRQIPAQSGGGALMDMGVHCLDLIEYISDMKTKKVAAMASNLTFDYKVEDSSALLLELENGALCHVEAHFNIPDDAARCRLEFYGTKGSMLAEGTISQIEGGTLDVTFSEESKAYDAIQNRDDDSTRRVESDFGNMYAKEIDSFDRSIRQGSPLEVPGEDGVRIQRTIEAAYKSSQTGTVIQL